MSFISRFCACSSRCLCYGWISGQPSRARHNPCFEAPYSLILGTVSFCASLVIISNSIFDGLLALSLSFILLTCALSSQVRLYYRTGVWSSVPCTKDEIIEQVGNSLAPVAIAEGWSFQLGFKNASHPAISLRGNWSGIVSWKGDSAVRVRSGTLFGELTRDLWDKGLTCVDRPQFDQLSIGGAVRTAGHGWSTEKWFIDTVVALEGVERGTGLVLEAKRHDAKFWTIAFDEQWVILEVEFQLVPNDLVFVEEEVSCPSVLPTDRESSVEAPLLPAPYSLMFSSAKQLVRKQATYVTKSDTNPDWYYTSPWFTFWSAVALQAERASNVSYAAYIEDAHTIVQTLGPIAAFFQELLNARNVEFFVPQHFNWDLAADLLAEFHQNHGGRTELRERRISGHTITAFDVALFCGLRERSQTETPKKIAAYINFLHDKLGVTAAGVHTGKYIPPEMGAIKMLSYTDLWSDTSVKALTKLPNLLTSTVAQAKLQVCC